MLCAFSVLNIAIFSGIPVLCSTRRCTDALPKRAGLPVNMLSFRAQENPGIILLRHCRVFCSTQDSTSSVMACGHSTCWHADLKESLLASLCFGIPVFVLAKAPMLSSSVASFLHTQFLGFPLDEILKWALSTPAIFVVGARFHFGAIAAVRRGAANMDVLVSLGTLASYAYSVISILHHHFQLHHVSGALWRCNLQLSQC